MLLDAPLFLDIFVFIDVRHTLSSDYMYHYDHRLCCHDFCFHFLYTAHAVFEDDLYTVASVVLWT